MPPGSPFVYVLETTAVVAAAGLTVQGLRTLVTRRVPRLLVRIRGEAIARQPLRLGGFQVLAGAALLLMETNYLPIPYGLGMVMFVAAGVFVTAAVVWYAARRS